MPSQIRVDTDHLRAIARQLRTSADQISTNSLAANQSLDALAQVWSGQARERGLAYWQRVYPRHQPATEELRTMATALEALAARLEGAAAVFGAGTGESGAINAIGDAVTGGGPSPSLPINATGDALLKSKPPSSMFEMYERMREGDNEIKIFQVGENEFAITIDGTEQFGVYGGNSWQNAIASGLGLNTTYADRVREAIAKLPPGAKLHMFGYSQGGIVAQNIASEGNFLKDHGIKLVSVNTFGTPRPIFGYADSVKYNEFDAVGDVVSTLGSTSDIFFIQTPETKAAEVLFGVGHSLIFGTHGSYGEKNSDIAKIMADVNDRGKLPFSKIPPEQFDIYKKDGIEVVCDMDSETRTTQEIGLDLGFTAINALSDTSKAIVDGYNATTGAIQAGVDTSIKVAEDVGNSIKDGFIQGINNIGNVIKNPPWPFG